MSLLARALGAHRARLSRAFSSAPGGGLAGRSTMDNLGNAAVIGACYAGAALWLYNDYLEKPKPDTPTAEALAASSTARGVEAIAAEMASLREQIEAMDETARWLAGGCRTGPLVIVGTGGGSESVFAFRISPSRTAAAAVGEPLKVGANPSFVSASTSTGKHVLYVAHEGAVSAVAADARDATLALLGGAQSSNGQGTAYAAPDGRACRHVLAANYAGGSVCVLPVLPDGSLGAATDAKHHVIDDPKPHLADRQASAHPHSVRVDPWAGKWALVPDLGLDTVLVYAYDAAKGVLAGAPNATRHWRAREGAGPRHICFSPVRAAPRRAAQAGQRAAAACTRRARAMRTRGTRVAQALGHGWRRALEFAKNSPFRLSTFCRLIRAVCAPPPRAALSRRSRAPQPSRAAHLVYALCEMDGTACVLQLNDSDGSLTELQTVSLLPHYVQPTREGHCGSAEIAMHPSGKFVYASNRCVRGAPFDAGHPPLPPPLPPPPPVQHAPVALSALPARRQNHSISILKVDEATGKLSMHANVPCGGKTPRHFQISPSGDFLVVANQSSCDIALFQIDCKSGMLSKPAITAVPASPRCICILDDADQPLVLN